MLSKKIILISAIVLSGIGLFWGCDTYRKSLPLSFDAVRNDSKFHKGEILMFRFFICDNDTFSLAINGIQLYTAFLPSESSPTTWTDKNKTDGHTYHYYDFVIYQYSTNKAIMYLVGNPNISFTIPLHLKTIDITGSYSTSEFKYSVTMGDCKQFILHHYHKDGIIFKEECLQGIRYYE